MLHPPLMVSNDFQFERCSFSKSLSIVKSKSSYWKTLYSEHRDVATSNFLCTFHLRTKFKMALFLISWQNSCFRFRLTADCFHNVKVFRERWKKTSFEFRFLIKHRKPNLLNCGTNWFHIYPYSPDMTFSYYCLFGNVIRFLQGKRFTSNKEIMKQRSFQTHVNIRLCKLFKWHLFEVFVFRFNKIVIKLILTWAFCFYPLSEQV